MNKNFSISKTCIYLILLVIVLIVYGFIYFIPSRSELRMLQSEIALFNAETSIYRQYLEDSTPLEADIADIQAEIDRMHAEDYINEAGVSFELSSAIQRYRLSVSSVTLSSSTTVDGNRALPVNLVITGDFENLMDFISYFENNEEGSYRVQGATVSFNGTNSSATLLIYLCSPNV